jgi:hypothetical protein
MSATAKYLGVEKRKSWTACDYLSSKCLELNHSGMECGSWSTRVIFDEDLRAYKATCLYHLPSFQNSERAENYRIKLAGDSVIGFINK